MTQIQEELGKQRHSGNGKGRSVSSSWGRDGLLVFPHDFYGNGLVQMCFLQSTHYVKENDVEIYMPLKYLYLMLQ